MLWASVASNARMKQACPETLLCMLREEYTDMCPRILTHRGNARESEGFQGWRTANHVHQPNLRFLRGTTYTFFLQRISVSAPYRETLINLPLIITVIELPSRIIPQFRPSDSSQQLQHQWHELRQHHIQQQAHHV